ncbi:hypothetical protein M9X92_011103 [Pyricularia oryzae]|nr:hypothetical protein M9X92_011103 [Pyricularia oryzae]
MKTSSFDELDAVFSCKESFKVRCSKEDSPQSVPTALMIFDSFDDDTIYSVIPRVISSGGMQGQAERSVCYGEGRSCAPRQLEPQLRPSCKVLCKKVLTTASPVSESIFERIYNPENLDGSQRPYRLSRKVSLACDHLANDKPKDAVRPLRKAIAFHGHNSLRNRISLPFNPQKDSLLAMALNKGRSFPILMYSNSFRRFLPPIKGQK